MNVNQFVSEMEVISPTNSKLVRERYGYNFQNLNYYKQSQIGFSDVLRPSSFKYSPNGRLVSGTWNSKSLEYRYDDFGSLTYKKEGNHIVDIAHHNYNGTVNYGSRVDTAVSSEFGNLKYEYDDIGNIVSNGRNTFIFDQTGRLTSAPDANETYYYDGHGVRVVRKTESGYEITARDKDGNLLVRADSASNKYTNYIYLDSTLIASNESTCGDLCSGMALLSPRTENITDEDLLEADLAVSLKGKNGKWKNGSISFAALIDNLGLDVSQNAILTVSIPTGVEGASYSGADCRIAADEFFCELGDLALGDHIEVLFTVNTTNKKTKFEFTATLRATTIDPEPTNNGKTGKFGGAFQWFFLCLLVVLSSVRRNLLNLQSLYFLSRGNA